jgi:prepilin signal peptidase PulO-like enzyme (type II secretory pathway)
MRMGLIRFQCLLVYFMSADNISVLIATISVAGVIGLFVGSFLNVVVYRTPLGLSVSTPRSFCPSCRRQLTWWENIPLASWIGLRGHCRTCHVSISVRYPLVELVTGLSFALVTWAWHGTLVSAGYCCLSASMIAVGLIEFDDKRAPLSVAAIGTGTAVLVIVIGAGWHHQWRILAGSLVGTVVAIAAFTALRTVDPNCLDPRGHGRSSLLPAGCWLGALGLGPTAIGIGFWILTYFLCMVGAWVLTRRVLDSGPEYAVGRYIPPVFRAPLVSAVVVALVASLVAGA